MKGSRKWVWLCFLGAILAALPVWRQTTSTYRATLPCIEGQAWANSTEEHTKWVIDLDIVVLSQGGHEQLATDFANQVKSHLDATLGESALQVRSHEIVSEPQQPNKRTSVSYVYRVTPTAVPLSAKERGSLSQASSLRDVDQALGRRVKTEKSGRYTLFILHGSDLLAAGRANEWVLGVHRHAWLATASLADSNRTAAGIRDVVERYLVTPIETDGQTSTHQLHQVSLPPAPEYRLSFSLLNPHSTQTLYTWSFDQAAAAYLRPFLNDVSVLGNFSIDSQVLHYVTLPQQPLYDLKTRAYYFKPAMLSYFVHPNDLNSDFTVTSEATLNFMIYVPSPDQSPLYIRYDDGSYSSTNAFLVLRTGGIVILNPEEKNTTSALRNLEPAELRGPMSVFVQQLRELLGVPAASFPTDSGEKGGNETGPGTNTVRILPAASGIAKWELDALLRQRTYENLAKAKTSILTLCQLVKKQTHMVVHDHIKDKLLSALHKLRLALDHLEESSAQGFDYPTAHRYALEGLKEAESAFFDREMVSLLYYPPEHEAAIYIPHFLPVFYPIVVGLLFELQNVIAKRVRKWWQRRQARKAAAIAALPPPQATETEASAEPEEASTTPEPNEKD